MTLISAEAQAAVDAEDLAGDVRRVVAGEEGDDAGDLFGRADAASGDQVLI